MVDAGEGSNVDLFMMKKKGLFVITLLTVKMVPSVDILPAESVGIFTKILESKYQEVKNKRIQVTKNNIKMESNQLVGAGF